MLFTCHEPSIYVRCHESHVKKIIEMNLFQVNIPCNILHNHITHGIYLKEIMSMWIYHVKCQTAACVCMWNLSSMFIWRIKIINGSVFHIMLIAINQCISSAKAPLQLEGVWSDIFILIHIIPLAHTSALTKSVWQQRALQVLTSGPGC